MPNGWCTLVSAGADRKSMRWILAPSVLLALALAGCSSQNFGPEPLPATSYYAAPANFRGIRTEVASWYGPGFAGHPTSTGESYNPEALTAASKTLPLGSHVRVTNPDNGRSVVVRINDRGPFVRGRSLDLSHGAARQIGLTGKGVGRVEVTPTATSTPSAGSSGLNYADSAVYSRPHLSYVSYRPRQSHCRRTYRRHSSSRRMVANPIADALACIVPRF